MNLYSFLASEAEYQLHLLILYLRRENPQYQLDSGTGPDAVVTRTIPDPIRN
jgi:hypothetical protein